MRKMILELRVSLAVWGRYVFRMFFFGMCTFVILGVIVSLYPGSPLEKAQFAGSGRVVAMTILLGYSIALFRSNRALFRPILSRKWQIQMAVRQRKSRKGPATIVPLSRHKMGVRLWWGFAWRSSLLYIPIGIYLASIGLPLRFDAVAQMDISSLNLLWILFANLIATWWFVFHPYGKTVLMVEEKPRV